MASITLDHLSVQFPFYDAFHRSFKNKLLLNSAVISPGTVTEKYYINAVSDLSLKLISGDRVAVLGSNGAGKTTLIRILSGLILPSSGTITVSGQAMAVLNIGFGYNSHATILDTIRLKGLLAGYSVDKINQIAAKISNFSLLEQSLNQNLENLTADHIFRLGIAMAFHFNNDIILLDEVLETQDHEFIDRIKNFITDTFTHDGILILVERSQKILEGICNKAIVLENGKIKAFGQFDDIINQWGDQYVL